MAEPPAPPQDAISGDHVVTHSASLAVDQTPSQCERTARQHLSPLASAVLTNIEKTPGALAKSPTAPDLLLTTCNRLDAVLIDGPAIFAGAQRILARADHEVVIAFYKWEAASDGARAIGEGLIAAQQNQTTGHPLIARFLIDRISTSGDVLGQFAASLAAWRSRGLDLSRVQIHFATSDRATMFAANLHDKYVAVDARYLLVTGANPEAYHNAIPGPPWHDTGYLLEGDVARAAFSAFDQVWRRDLTTFWNCTPAPCQRSPRRPVPRRDWRDPAPLTVGEVPVLAVGKTHDGGGIDPPNEVNNPQAVAWLTVMDSARSRIDVESPNLNDDAFRAAVVRAVGRGVTVRLIAAMGFNDGAADMIGGDNQEVIGDLRQDIRAAHPANASLFQVRWYSKNGKGIIDGNGPGANHTKYMAVDDRVAIVGSGNHEAPAWNISHEFNVLVDDSSSTAELRRQVFEPDWAQSVHAYAELYEGPNGTQDMICPVSLPPGVRKFERLNGNPCSNDEAQSLLLHGVPANTNLRLYEDPNGNYQDHDWTEIRTKRALDQRYIRSLERSFEDDEVRVIAHRNRKLGGKVSAIETVLEPTGLVLDLHEGRSGQQQLVCSRRVPVPVTINLWRDPHCNDDEAVSLSIFDLEPDRVIFLYDNPNGSLSDDWAVVVPKRFVKSTVVASPDTDAQNADVALFTFGYNGLGGKVSRVRVAGREALSPILSLYPTRSVGRLKICDLNVRDRQTNLKKHETCENDRAGALVLTFIAQGVTVELFDSPDCSDTDDHVRLVAKRPFDRRSLGSLHTSFEDDDLKVMYHRKDGLNGSVSCVKIAMP